MRVIPRLAVLALGVGAVCRCTVFVGLAGLGGEGGHASTTATGPSGTGGGTTNTDAGGGPDGAIAPPDGGNDTYVLIDDMESPSRRMVFGNGNWFVYSDGTDGGVETPGSLFANTLIAPSRSVSPPFAAFTGTTSTLAAQCSGGGFAQFAGMGFNLYTPRHGVDVSAYDGVVFWARVALRVGTLAASSSVRVLFPDWETDPQGGLCTKCNDHLGASFLPSTVWTEFKVPFTSLAQTGTGSPKVSRLTDIYGVEFQVQTVAPPGEPFQLWIDDIYFYTGP